MSFKWRLSLFCLVLFAACRKDEPTSPNRTLGTASVSRMRGTVYPYPANTLTWPGVFDPTVVMDVYLRMTPADWDVVRFDATNTIEKPAWFSAEGETEILVAVRRKSSRALPSETDPRKIGMKVDINELVSGQLWHGLNKLSLENGSDAGPAVEGAAWNMHEMASVSGYYGAGIHAGLASWVRVFIETDTTAPPELLGVYINAEQRDKQGLRNRNLWFNNLTWIYEIDDINGYELEEGAPHSDNYNALAFAPFQSSGGKGNGGGGSTAPNDPTLYTLLNSRIDMQAMLTEGAVDAITSNGDALFSHGKNFLFMDWANNSPRMRLYLPWDLDAAFAQHTAGIYGNLSNNNKVTQNNYQKVILNHPQFRVQYNNILTGLLSGPLDPGTVGSAIDSWKPAVVAALATDPYESALTHKSFDDIKSWLTLRKANILTQVQSNNKPAPRP